jgi:integrase
VPHSSAVPAGVGLAAGSLPDGDDRSGSRLGRWAGRGLLERGEGPVRAGAPRPRALSVCSRWRGAPGALGTRLYDLRHTCATLLLNSNVHPKYVQELLGHASISQTLDTYSHVLKGMDGGIGDAMDEAFG